MIACRQQYPVLVAKHVSIHGSFSQEPWNERTTIIHVPSPRSQSSHPISFIPCSVQLLHEGELFLDFNSTSTSWLMALPSPRMVGVLGNMVSHGVPKHKSLVSIKAPRQNIVFPTQEHDSANFITWFLWYIHILLQPTLTRWSSSVAPRRRSPTAVRAAFSPSPI